MVISQRVSKRKASSKGRQAPFVQDTLERATAKGKKNRVPHKHNRNSQIQQNQSDEKEEQKGKLLDQNERGRRKIVKEILKEK